MTRMPASDAVSRRGGPGGAPPALDAPSVLVVCGNPAQAGEVVGALQDHGLPSLQAGTDEQALRWARREPPALVLLDAGVEGWWPVMRELRSEGRAVVVLTDDAPARARALEAGCLEVASASADAQELALRAASLVRNTCDPPQSRIAVGPLIVDTAARRLYWKGEELAVSPLLLRVAAYLAARPGTTVPAQVLLEEVWGEPWASTRKVHQAIWRLRTLLGEGAGSTFIAGRPGHGYGIFLDSAATTPSLVSAS